MEGNHAFSHCVDDLIIVSCHDDSLSIFVERIEQMHDLVRVLAVEIPCGLIPDDDMRMMDEGSCYTGTLYLSSGECLDELPLFLEESDLREDLGDTLGNRLSVIATDFHCEGDIFSHCLASEELEVLEYDSHSSAILEEFSLRELRDIASSIIIDLSLLGSYRTDHRSDDTRLPASRCTDEEYEFSRLDREVDIS